MEFREKNLAMVHPLGVIIRPLGVAHIIHPVGALQKFGHGQPLSTVIRGVTGLW